MIRVIKPFIALRSWPRPFSPLTVCFGVVFTIYPVAMARAQDNIFEEQVLYIPIHRTPSSVGCCCFDYAGQGLFDFRYDHFATGDFVPFF